ncbi:hypothetical protein B9Z19DRAFT_1056355 [Tuber borchii]|uniref:Uncharacterized protein n=1 Tax=Tuber borchii TaxID=42251 RepID=A0A2T6ZFS1_TUBBO|nr:hypothetical protein B9Z19DRAFT_1056355 [Tuber borchii]
MRVLKDTAEGVAKVVQGQATILRKLEALQDRQDAIEKNRIARLINSRAKRDNTVLEPFYGFNGQLVLGFPRTLGDTKRLNNLDLTVLLFALGLPVSGSFAVRKARFFNHVGLVYLG